MLTEITLNGRKYKVSEQIKYLGVTLTSTLNRKLTNRQRCVGAFKTSQVVVEFCKKFGPKWEIGKLIYKTVLAPSLIYGTKISVLTKKSRISIANYEKLILRNIFNHCKKSDNVRFNAKKLLDGKTINRKIRIGRISYFGHIMRRDREHPLRKALQLKLEKKKEGRPSLTWNDSLEQDKNRYREITDAGWIEIAKDREKIKRKSEEIYQDSASEISDGESTDDNKSDRDRFKHWKRKVIRK